MIPIGAIQPWMLKAGAFVALLSVVFYGGCRVQKSMDRAKIQRLQMDYARAVEIIETYQENYDVIDKALKDQNEAIAKLGEESRRNLESIKAAHEEAVGRLTRHYADIVASQDDEAAELREKLAGLSDAEACREAMKELGR